MGLEHAGPVAEQVLLLANIGSSVLVGPEQLPSLHRLLLTAACTLQMEPPQLYVRQVRLPSHIMTASGNCSCFTACICGCSHRRRNSAQLALSIGYNGQMQACWQPFVQ